MKENQLQEIDKIEEDEDIDFSPFLNYLESEKGHEIASRVIVIIEDLKKAGIQTATSHAKFERLVQVGIIAVVVISASFLTFYGKFDSTLGVLFGSLVGYLFGKK